jgi:hypothetical protein
VIEATPPTWQAIVAFIVISFAVGVLFAVGNQVGQQNLRCVDDTDTVGANTAITE